MSREKEIPLTDLLKAVEVATTELAAAKETHRQARRAETQANTDEDIAGKRLVATREALDKRLDSTAEIYGRKCRPVEWVSVDK